MNEALDLLSSVGLRKVKVVEGGIIGYHRPDIAKFAYDVLVNEPMAKPVLESWEDWVGGEFMGDYRELFSICNGLLIGRSKFGVFGFRSDRNGAPIERYVKQPFDIVTPNAYPTGKNLLENDLVVGFSHEGSNETPFQHVFRAPSTILVLKRDELDSQPRCYQRVRDWLKTEIRSAASDAMAKKTGT